MEYKHLCKIFSFLCTSHNDITTTQQQNELLCYTNTALTTFEFHLNFWEKSSFSMRWTLFLRLLNLLDKILGKKCLKISQLSYLIFMPVLQMTSAVTLLEFIMTLSRGKDGLFFQG